MEEPRVASLQGQEAHEPKPTNLIGAGPVAVTASASAPDSKKRKPNDGGFHNSEYVKVRALVKELRPFFMEVTLFLIYLIPDQTWLLSTRIFLFFFFSAQWALAFR